MINKPHRIARILFAAALGVSSLAFATDWPTARGNPQRTGNVDAQPGPVKAPKVLWVYDTQEHFVAAPAIDGQRVYISGLGAFNTASFQAIKLDPAAKEREAWAKRTPFLKLPVVCSPAIAEGHVIFGDGMHQTDGATLYCLSADSGRPLWQLPQPGALVHLEGAPTIANGKAYIGGGAAGVLCVDINAVTLDGQPATLAHVEKAIDTKWKELQAAYEADKKKDPDFAIPPSEDQLPKPAPKLVWQVGQGKLHVDSPLAVVGGNVLAASARLDMEKVGDRALHCLDAATGQTKWRTELTHNPWSGATVAGQTVLIGSSSIRLDTKEIPHGKGEVVALNLSDGKLLWRQPIPGGVVSNIAVDGDTAVFTATDGKVRAIGVKDAGEKWAYDAKTPFFAGPAVAGGVVYAADLKGVVHAIDLAKGQKIWTLDLAADPAVKASGMVYGSPVVHGGRIYLGTCNIEGGAGQQRPAFVCIGE